MDESSDIEEEDDDEEVDEDEHLLHDNIDERLQPLDPTIPPECSLVDLSSLTLDERAHMHLRRAGMLENHPPPGPNEVSNGLKSNSSRGRKDDPGDGTANTQAGDGETLEDIIERMSAHLLQLNKGNNARASFLESVARTHMSASGSSKADEESSLIAKCQQLLKKSKDSKVKSSKPRTGAKDEYALPW